MGAVPSERPPEPPHPSQLPALQAALRFLIEIAALVCWGWIGWEIAPGGWRWAAAIVLPLIGAIVWATFRAPGDHSAGGGAPVAVPGIVRLLIELGVLGGAAVTVALVGHPIVGLVLGAAIVVHHAATVPRLRWLVTSPSSDGTSVER